MPQVKIDYIVSFSSEDPDNPATNLLLNNISKKRWLAKQGEQSCSVVLQLKKSVKISAINIGVHHAAVVEIFVGRSEVPSEFKALMLSHIFLNCKESRQNESIERVKLFSSDAFIAEVKDQMWDRVRIVCSQPYNRHCKYGLGFVHILEPDAPDTSLTTSQVKSAECSFLQDFPSDEEDFKPGELFAVHLQRSQSDKQDSQPLAVEDKSKRSTLQSIRNADVGSAKLVKAQINKEKLPTRKRSCSLESSNQQRNNVMYTDEDEQPHRKIDAVVMRHNEEKSNKERMSDSAKNDKKKECKTTENTTVQKNKKNDSDKSRDKNTSISNNTIKPVDSGRTPKRKIEDNTNGQPNHNKIRSQTMDKTETVRAGPVSSSPHELLRGAVFALSGYENPRRARLRDLALAMGARYERDWNPRCTHLICAFPNTPKLRTVRASPGGDSCVAVTGEWLDECSERRRMMPWQWFATEPARRLPRPPQLDDDGDDNSRDAEQTNTSQDNVDDEMDTDDEIKRVMQNQKRDVEEAAKNKKEKVHETKKEIRQKDVVMSVSDGGSTDEESAPERRAAAEPHNTLPNFFDGYTFLVDEEVNDVGFDSKLLKRYIQAYGGEVLKLSQLDESSEVDYVLCTSAGCACARRAKGAQVLRADWLWVCHKKKKLCVKEFEKFSVV